MNIKPYFTSKGSVNRQHYWGTMIISWALMLAGIFVVGLVAAGISQITIYPEIVGGTILGLGGLVLVVAHTIVHFCNIIKRCRDSGINVWWTLSTVIPYVGFIVIIILGCLPTQQKN